jgi:hypothetical protein
MLAAGLKGGAIPNKLEGSRGSRPRLFVDAARLEEIRGTIETSHAAVWKQLVSVADGLAGRKPPAYRAGAVDRGVGNTISTLAFTYLVSRDRKYLDGAAIWARASCEYPAWEVDSKGKPADYGLVFGHHLLGLAMLYDYAGPELDAGLRKLVRETMAARAATQHVVYKDSAPAGYLCNQTWVNAAGMLAAGLALFDEEPGATDWIAVARSTMGKTTLALGTDGATQEGAGYWEYGLEYLLKLMHLSRQLLGDDYYGHPWFRQASEYGLHLSVPRVSWTKASSLADLGDCPRYHWYGPDYQLRGLAAEYRDGTAQWLAGQVDGHGTEAPVSPWLNVLWFDAGVKEAAPGPKDTARHFEDFGIVSARSNWSGDESLVVFKCGPALGWHATQKQQELVKNSGGHAHPDANHFVFFGHGEWLIRNEGYVKRQTKFHNTLLVDGKGQYDAAGWFDVEAQMRAGRFPKVLRVEFGADWDWMTGDATEAYEPEIGVKRYIRHVIFLKPDVLIVADEVEVSKAQKLELLFHTERPLLEQPDGTMVSRGRSAALRAELLTEGEVRLEAGSMPIAARHPDGKPDRVNPVLYLRAEAARMESAIAFSCSVASAEPARVKLRREGAVRVFSFGDKSYPFDFGRA